MLCFYEKKLIFLLITIIVLPATTLAAQSKNNTDPLAPYTTCGVGGGLEIKLVTRRPKSTEKNREVKTAKGEEKVSVVDGYRVMFGYKGVRYYFANIKIEQSDSQSYAQDKEAVINQLIHYSSTKQATKILYTEKVLLNGFEHYGIDRDVIDVGGQVGIHVIFHDSAHLIITIYFLNQEKESIFLIKKRRYNNIEEYQVIKDDFLNRYTECLKGIANQ